MNVNRVCIEMNCLPSSIENEAHLEDLLSTPRADLVEYFANLEGDILVLGAGGKMGPTLARMARRALDQAKAQNKVIAVSRFTNSDAHRILLEHGVETIQCDLMNRTALERLPSCQNVIYMTGRKFGSDGAEWETWAMNAYLAGMAAERFEHSRIVAFSTGNVYPFVPFNSGGCTEEHPLGPVGEYAQSCLARERIFEYFSRKNNTPVTLLRLNYAVEMRYGVLLEIAEKVNQGVSIDLTMGHVNVIWQGDASHYALMSLQACQAPAAPLNLTGTETLSVRSLAERFGERLKKKPVFDGEEAETALLNNAAKCMRQYGETTVSTETIMTWVADWVQREMPTWNKPTRFQTRSGKF